MDMTVSGPFVIVGAGPAGIRAAEILRQQAPDADILLIGEESHLPYQRPPLSKAYLTDRLSAAQLYLKPEAFFAEHRIGLKLGCAAIRIDRPAKLVELADGEKVKYGRLLLATGCRYRVLPPIPGGARVYYLRSLSDAERIREVLTPGAEIVMIGGGFIGLELAASATQLGSRVTVLEAAPRLLARALPPLIGDFVRTLHEKHGVKFEFDSRLKSMEAGQNGRVLVRTERAEHNCDIVIAGIGAQPNTALAEAAGLEVDDGIRVDQYGRTSDPDIFAAGDVTRHHNPLLGRAIRVESWQVALNQAAAVARAMLGTNEPYAEIPWLWTDQYDCNIQMLGLVEPDLDLVVRGDPASNQFTIIGLGPDRRIAAAITVNNGREMSALRRLIATKAIFPRETLADPGQKLSDLLKSAAPKP
jgi:anthranilate 1,2-dioxygenase ferredoxin reductase subunit